MLAAALGERVAEPFREAARGAAPLVVPVDVADPRVEIERLRGHGVVAAALGPGRVGLPCHHQLTPDQVERVADAAAGGAGRAAGPRRSGELVVEPLGSIEEAREVWLELQERDGNLFGTFEWADAWWRHFGAGRPLHLHLCSDADGRPVGLLPLYRGAQRPLRTVRLVGHGPADRLAPICAPADRPRVAAALRRTLDTLGADVFVADELPADEGWAGLIGGLTLRREASPVLPARGMDFPAFLASRSRNFREQVRRRERALRRHHDVAFRLTEDPEALDADLDVLYRLHEARWEEQSSTFTEGPPRDFHRAFARLALERGWLRLWLLEVDGEPVAAWQGFRYAGSEWYYQSGRETSWDWRSVGFVLLAHSVRAALDEGVDEYRLLRGGEQYKGRFSTFDPELEVVARPLSPLGAAAARAGMGARALPADVRRALVRTAG
jgi:CelD/BcsL family acetyltransferase involved in cellulose biosynthesis